MKLVHSLLALIQFVALGQIVYGLIIVEVVYSTPESAILPFIPENDRSRVEHWHRNTVDTTKSWCVWSGITTFGLATGVIIALRRSAKARKTSEV